jgi:alpha-ribazole phosphatase
MRLYLVRHPQPVVEPEVCYGSTDLYVMPEQHAQVCTALVAGLPRDAPIFSSPLLRCANLAQRLSAQLGGAPAILDARLVEMNFGAWELCRWDAIPRAEIDAWTNDTLQYRPGGGESVLQMAQRMRAFYEELISLGHDCATIVCHAGTIRMLLACQRGLPLEEMARYAVQIRSSVAYGEMVSLDC